MSTVAPTSMEETRFLSLAGKYHFIRQQTARVCATLSAEDQMVQSCAEASPTKWHQAHTSWFFETFVLSAFAEEYAPFHPDFHWLFNSYYISLGGEIPEKKLRASFSRPSLDAIVSYRAHVDAAMRKLLQREPPEEAVRRTVIGLNHEQQHLELLLTDIKHAFFTNPLHPVFREDPGVPPPVPSVPLSFLPFEGGVQSLGYALQESDPFDFAFDNETPRHRVFVEPFKLANRLTTCGEYLAFLTENGYGRPELWLSEGWNAVQAERWEAPLYWQRDARDESGWRIFTLGGWKPLSQMMDTPVCHVSLFEADAFARWSRCRLSTEAEWEIATSGLILEESNLEDGTLHPLPATESGLQQMTGACWQWTASAYTGYPGYKPLPGALGEYNGKFMSSQMVLRGGSCVTPEGHLRYSYRNFFQPATRWQFSGIRLAQ